VRWNNAEISFALTKFPIDSEDINMNAKSPERDFIKYAIQRGLVALVPDARHPDYKPRYTLTDEGRALKDIVRQWGIKTFNDSDASEYVQRLFITLLSGGEFAAKGSRFNGDIFRDRVDSLHIILCGVDMAASVEPKPDTWYEFESTLDGSTGKCGLYGQVRCACGAKGGEMRLKADESGLATIIRALTDH
jgi:hypothetical protein